MEGGPQQPEDRLTEEMQGFLLYIQTLPLTKEEQRMLATLLAEKTFGQLSILVEKKVWREIIIDPTKTDDELIKELTASFDSVYEEALDKTPNEPLPPWKSELEMSITFSPLSKNNLH